MATVDPKTPIRADHRILDKMYKLLLGGKAVSLPAEYDRISRVFVQAGGSWVGVFQGSTKDLELLKRVIKVAYKRGYITKKGKW